MRKTDIRVIYTKKVIREALFDCLKRTGSIKDVTVKEVCQLANLNRTTFYKHYKDCFDVIDQLENEEIKEFREILGNSEDLFSREVAEKIIDLFDRYSDLTEAYANGSTGGRLKEKMIEVSHELFIDSWKAKYPRTKKKEVEMLFSSVSAVFFQLVITERDKYTMEESLGFLYRLISPLTEKKSK